MAERNYHQAGLQHLAHLRQEVSALPAVVLTQHQHQPQVALAEAGLEAHLQHIQLHQAMLAVQELERQRVQTLSLDSEANRPL